MIERDQARDTERLPEETVRRLLARASELEVSRVSEMSVAETARGGTGSRNRAWCI